MKTLKYSAIPLALVATVLVSACGGSTPKPIYEDQTYTKYGTATQEAGSGALAGCVHGQGTMQAGTLICPDY